MSLYFNNCFCRTPERFTIPTSINTIDVKTLNRIFNSKKRWETLYLMIMNVSGNHNALQITILV